MNVGIYIYDQAEVLDFSGPFEVFATASRFLSEQQKFNVFLVAENSGPINARANYSINPQYHFDSHPGIDLLIVVGGVHYAELDKPVVLNWIKAAAEDATIVASVCTGAAILAKTGLLDGLDVTTHWQDIEELANNHAELNVIKDRRWVDQGKFVTSAGISAGIDMSLHLVSRIFDIELAEKTARQMEYDWVKY